MIPWDFCKVDEKILLGSAFREILVLQYRFNMPHYNFWCEGVHTAISIHAAASVEALTFFGWLNDRTFVE